LPILSSVEELIITIHGCDWNWEQMNLGLDARRCVADPLYHNHNTALVNRVVMEWNERGWGSALEDMAGLKEFQLQVE
jgi:hypothetical protein